MTLAKKISKIKKQILDKNLEDGQFVIYVSKVYENKGRVIKLTYVSLEDFEKNCESECEKFIGPNQNIKIEWRTIK